MLQQEKPEDYVLSTNEFHSVREFVEMAFSLRGFDIRWEGEGLQEVGVDTHTNRTLVKVNHPERGEYISVGCPIKLSASPAEVTRSPLLGEHTTEILTEVLGYSADEMSEIIASGAVGEVKAAAE